MRALILMVLAYVAGAGWRNVLAWATTPFGVVCLAVAAVVLYLYSVDEPVKHTTPPTVDEYQKLLPAVATPAVDAAATADGKAADPQTARDAADARARMYTDLLARTLCGISYEDEANWGIEMDPVAVGRQFSRLDGFSLPLRLVGEDQPARAETMTGYTRLKNVEQCVTHALKHGVAGDVIETGVARGGSIVMMKGVLAAYGDTTRRVFGADAFCAAKELSPLYKAWVLPVVSAVLRVIAAIPSQGLRNRLFEGAVREMPVFPSKVSSAANAARTSMRQDTRDRFFELVMFLTRHLEFTIESARGLGQAEIRRTFARYGLWDDRIAFIPGFFCNSLPTAEQDHGLKQLAVLRLDGDLYDSTMDPLVHLYPKLNPAGGFIIIDDYESYPECKRAVDEYRAKHNITEPIVKVDRNAVFWQRGNFAPETTLPWLRK